MNNDSLPPDQVEHDLGLSLQDRIDILFNEIELAAKWDRPSILFAIYKSGIVRDEANAILTEKLNDIGQKSHFVKTSINDQFDFLTQISQLPDLSQTVLIIDGFNWECGTEGVAVFKEFNKNREYFIDNNIRAIFWLFENEVSDFATNATECWILRHRVVEFMDLPQNRQETIQSQDSPVQSQGEIPDNINPAGNHHEIRIMFETTEKRNASHANGLLSLGLLFWRKGNPQKALKYLRKSGEISLALGDQSLQSQYQNALALVHTELGNNEEAVSAYQSALTLTPDSEKLWCNLGQILAKCERNEEAINAFTKATALSPGDYLSWDGIGHVYNKLGEFLNGIAAFEKALEIEPDYETSWAGIGESYLKTDQLDKAENSLRKAVEKNTHLWDAWINLGRCLHMQRRDPDAIAVYQKAIELNPQNASLWDELGKLQLERQNYNESIAAFQEVISLDPKRSEAHVRLAHALFQIGDFEASASIYDKCIPLFDDDVTRAALWDRLGDTYLFLKDYENAIGAYKQSEQIQNEFPDRDKKSSDLPLESKNTPLNNDQKTEQGEPEDYRGEKMIEANQPLDLKTAAEWNEHGNTQLKAGAYNDAIVAYTKAIELAPEASWPYIQNLAQVHYQKGKAKGKLIVGKTEDPDVWEAEDETDSAPLNGLNELSGVDQNNQIEEPRLEKEPSNNSIDRPDVANIFKIELADKAEINENSSPIQTENNVEPEPGSALPASTPEATKVSHEQDTRPAEKENSPAYQMDAHGLQNPVTRIESGNSSNNSKNIENDIKVCQNAIEADPKDGQAYSDLGYIYYQLGKYDFAVLLYKKSIDLMASQADKAISWNRLGDAYRRLGDYGKALTAYQKSSESAPSKVPVVARARMSFIDNMVAG